MEITPELYRVIIQLTEEVTASLEKKGSISDEEMIAWKTKMLESNASTPEELSSITSFENIVEYMKDTTRTSKADYYDRFVK